MEAANKFTLQSGTEYSPNRFQETTHSRISRDTRLIPLAFAAVAIVLQLLQAIVFYTKSYLKNRSKPATNDRGSPDVAVATSTGTSGLPQYARKFGGNTILAFTVARLAGCVTLFTLSVITLKQHQVEPIAGASIRWDELLGNPELCMSVAYSYSIILTLIPLISSQWKASVTRYNILLLLVAFGVYAYRDLWPLATYTQQPKDLADGGLVWAKVSVLAFIAVIIPLFIPRQYVPVDPKNPSVVPNPEQTASLFSLFTFMFLDETIVKGSMVEHLPAEELPPLADYDDANYLARQGFPHLDVFGGAKRRHLFFNLMIVFRKDYTILALTIIVQALANFASPIGINRILFYLETEGYRSDIKPWFWIIWLFLGPMIYTLSYQFYMFVVSRTLARAEALVTELVFEHSLRIRLKAETSNDALEVASAASAPPTSKDAPAKDAATVTTPEMEGARIPNVDSTTSSEISQTSTVVTSKKPSAVGSEASASKADQNGKAKAKSNPEKVENKSGKDANFIGRLNNLVTTDLQNIVRAKDFLILLLYIPITITLCMVFLFQVLGWSAFVGFIMIIVLIPLPGYVATKQQTVQKARMKATDARVQSITEAFNVLRMIKLFGWEQKMSARIDAKREEELRMMWKSKSLEVINGMLSAFIPTVTMIITYATYTLFFKQTLAASKIFSSLAVFTMLRDQLTRINWQYVFIIQSKISLDRLGDFLATTELLDAFDSNSKEPVVAVSSIVNAEIGFRNATFMWSKEAAEHTAEAERSFKLRIDGELLFKRGTVNLIIGPTGSGKTSILMALLGEMHFMATDTDSWCNLPRTGGVSYAAQESWVQNETIRNNILFGNPYDEERYQQVIKQCALEHDLELFEAGDNTEVGERGLTLSGGQKARVTLARAIYSPAKILLLDDILAALDVHTSAWVIDQCLRGDLVKGRTVLLVTHNITLASPIAEFVVSVGLDGKIRTQGTEISVALSRDSTLAAETEQVTEATEIGVQDIEATDVAKPSTQGKLVLAEEIPRGHITAGSLKLLITSLGGNHPLMFMAIFMGGFALTEFSMIFQTWFLGYWGTQYEGRDPSQVNVPFYVLIYSGLLFLTIALYSASFLYFVRGTIRSARIINKALMKSIFGGTLRWLDETPTGRIIARCTQDIRTVDGMLPQLLLIVFDCVLQVFTKLAAVVLFTPLFFFPGLIVAAVGVYLGNLYLKAQLSVKRETSNARAPVLSHFSAAMHGLISIRAYDSQNAFKAESIRRINNYTRISRTSYNLNRWMSTRMEALGAIFTTCLALYLVYGPRVGSATTGFSLNMAVEFTTSILWMVRMFNMFEVESNSLERIKAYIDIDHEPQPTDAGKPPAAWPTSGDLRVEKLSARYSQSGPKVLHDISFDIKSGERIGVVGRTGSGKSSLTLALLRCILTEGTVYYDGIPTDKINLDALRSNITIIPQTPELISGTLRQNLDPFEQTEDAALNDALRAAGLFALQDEAGASRITLDTKISGGGSNLSTGQRQILALARAMIRESKILILDEATSAIDYKTDAIIQSTLRSQFDKNVSVITIAHRLQTIMDADKIMVLDNGRIVEFDKPADLLKRENSVLLSMVEGSGDKETLYKLAGL